MTRLNIAILSQLIENLTDLAIVADTQIRLALE
jgi:hypothetical protein